MVYHLKTTRVFRIVAGRVRFEPTTGTMEWHRIAAVNVSKLEREGDLQTLKQFLPDIAVGNVDEHDGDASPGLVNAFRLAQLQAQYVLHCQQVILFGVVRCCLSAGWRGTGKLVIAGGHGKVLKFGPNPDIFSRFEVLNA